MSTSPGPAPTSDPDLENLVAYLDGELDPEASRAVERRLSDDAGFRQQLRQLQQAWDLLDQLPQAQVEPSFTQSTVAMVAVKAEDDVAQLSSVTASRRRYTWTLAAAGVLAAFVAGYALVGRLGGRDDARLLRDLPVIQRIDQLRYAESLDFLRLLERERLFVEEEVNHAAEAPRTP